jgi:hypothetical protein
MKRYGRLGMLVLALSAALPIAWSGDAFAMGSVVLKTPSPQETSSGEWNITMKITLDQAPATSPILYFTFTESTTFERTLEVRGQPPVLHRLPVDPPHKFPPESMPVDTFTDPVSHHPVKTTVWTVPVKRSAGYEAGVYQLQVSTSDGQNIGAPMQLTLNGDNPVVDRADISFGGNITSVHSGVDAGGPPQVAQNDDTGDNPVPMSTNAPSGSAAPMVGEGAFNETPEEKARPHACGCSVIGAPEEASLGIVGALGALGLVAARKRKK